MDDQIEAMCWAGWTITFSPIQASRVHGEAEHSEHGFVEHISGNAQKVQDRLLTDAMEKDARLRRFWTGATE